VIDSQVFDDGLRITLPHLKRQFDDSGTTGELFASAFGGYVNEFYSWNQKLNGLLSRGVSQGQGGGQTDRRSQGRRGLDVNNPVKAREPDDRDNAGEQLVDTSGGMIQYVNGFSFNNPKLKDLFTRAISQGGGQSGRLSQGRRGLDVSNPLKAREPDDRDNAGEQLVDTSGGMIQYVNEFSFNNPRLKDLFTRAISQGGGQNGRLSQGRRSLDVNEPVEARDNVINSQTLAQLQSFVNDTVSLLCAVGKPDGKRLYPSVHLNKR
jgi:hypothetical protein